MSTKLELDKYLDKINYGYDGYLHEVHFSQYLNDVELITSIYGENGEGLILTMKLTAIQKCKFFKFYNSLFALMSSGIKYKQFDGLHFVSFEVSEDGEELNSAELFK